jgi:tetratricopeptide (TPR) repeat protein
VCWTPDGKALVYARSPAPAPADHAADMPKDSCDLYLLDLATKKETRLSRGGGFTSPSMAKDDKDVVWLFFLSRTPQEGAPPTVELMEMNFAAARDFAADQERLARDRAKAWGELADVVLKEAGIVNVDGRGLDAGSMKKIAAAFAQHYDEKLKADPPATPAALERQRRELARLDLPAAEQDRLVLLLGAVEGEYLLGRQKGSAWHLASKPDVTAHAENPFGVAFNPFRPLRPRDKADKDDAPRSLAEVLYRAEGRPLVLSQEPGTAKKALDDLVDGDLARGTELLKAGKGDEGERVLREMTKRQAGNYYLAVRVGALLYGHGRTKALAELLKPALDQLDAPGQPLPRDARLYNLLGVVLLDGDAQKAQKAVTAFQDALRCDLNYGPAYLNLAQAYQKTNRPPDARQCLRRYLKLFPDGELAGDARRRLNAAGDDNGP